MWSNLHHLVPGAVVSQVAQAVHKALAGLAVDPARLQHGLALFHQLGGNTHNIHNNTVRFLLNTQTKRDPRCLMAGRNHYE